MFNSKDEFMDYINQKYPNENWDIFDSKNTPIIYRVRGKYKVIRLSKQIGLTDEDSNEFMHFSIDGDYKTVEEALAIVEKVRNWPLEIGTDESSMTGDDKVMLKVDSVEYYECRTDEVLNKMFCKLILDGIKDNTIEFPVYFF